MDHNLFRAALADPLFAHDPYHLLYKPIVLQLETILSDYLHLPASLPVLLRCRRPVILSYLAIKLEIEIGDKKAELEKKPSGQMAYSLLYMSYWQQQLRLIDTVETHLSRLNSYKTELDQEKALKQLALDNWRYHTNQGKILVAEVLRTRPTLFLTLETES